MQSLTACFSVLLLLSTAYGLTVEGGADLYGFGNVDSNDNNCHAIAGGNVNQACGSSTPCSLCFPQKVAANITQVCSGREHTLILSGEGKVLGAGTLSLLGTGSSSDSCTNPTDFLEIGAINALVSTHGAVKRLTCNMNYTAVLFGDGEVFVNGKNTNGALAAANATESPAFSSPTLLNMTDLLNSSDVTLRVLQVEFGLDAMIFRLSNGSVGTAGSGVLRGVSSSETTSPILLDASIPSSCEPQDIAVLFQHAIVQCADGTAYGWGDNTFNQLTSSTSETTIAEPTLLTLPSLSNATTAKFSVGASHTLVVDTASQTVFARGDNAAGQLALPVSVVTQATWVQILTSTPILEVAVGNGYSVATSSTPQLTSSTGGYSNMWVTGSNGGCALGLDASTGSINAATPLPFTHQTNLLAKGVLGTEYRRTFALIKETRTITPSATVSDPTLSETVATASGSGTAGSTISMELSASTSLSVSRRTPTKSSTRSRASTRSVSDSHSSARSSSNTLSTTPSASFTTPQAPLIKSVLFVAEQASLNIIFDIPTNRNNGSNFANYAAEVDRLFVVRGVQQSFGVHYDGEWAGDDRFVLRYDQKYSNISATAARISVAPESLIRNKEGTSEPSPSFYSVPLQAVSNAAHGTTIRGIEGWLKIAAIAFCVGFVVLLLLVVVCSYFHANYTDAKREEERQRMEAVQPYYYEDNAPVERVVVEDDPVAKTVTYSSIYGPSRFDEYTLGTLPDDEMTNKQRDRNNLPYGGRPRPHRDEFGREIVDIEDEGESEDDHEQSAPSDPTNQNPIAVHVLSPSKRGVAMSANPNPVDLHTLKSGSFIELADATMIKSSKIIHVHSPEGGTKTKRVAVTSKHPHDFVTNSTRPTDPFAMAHYDPRQRRLPSIRDIREEWAIRDEREYLERDEMKNRSDWATVDRSPVRPRLQPDEYAGFVTASVLHSRGRFHLGQQDPGFGHADGQLLRSPLPQSESRRRQAFSATGTSPSTNNQYSDGAPQYHNEGEEEMVATEPTGQRHQDVAEHQQVNGKPPPSHSGGEVQTVSELEHARSGSVGVDAYYGHRSSRTPQ